MEQLMEMNPEILKKLEVLDQMSVLSNSAISVFDLARNVHIYFSSNFNDFLGFGSTLEESRHHLVHGIQDLIYEEDAEVIMKAGQAAMKAFSLLPAEQRMNCKLINEFRIKKANDKLFRVIEQHQVLALSEEGQLWLALSILDHTPNQNLGDKASSKLWIPDSLPQASLISYMNTQGGKGEAAALTLREKEILGMVNEGLLSKEISDKLGISLHTVNTHRQRVLRKLNAHNSLEAVRLGRQLGILSTDL